MKLRNRTINRLRKNYGDWALVTGATSGIGKELSVGLAKAGFNIVLTGRREEVLNALCKDLSDNYNIETKPIAGDLSSNEDMDFLLRNTQHLAIGIAILNAGFGTSGKFIHADVESELNMIDLNCKSVLKMSYHFANKFARQSSRGALVLLSSMVAFQGVPNTANYAATKAYVQSLGEGINRELKPLGVDVLCAAPGPVETAFFKRANMQVGKTMSAETVAKSIIHSIGLKNTVLPGFLTKFLVYNLRLLPRWGKIKVMGKVMSGFTKHQSSTI